MENKTSKRIKLLIAAVLVLFLGMWLIDFFQSGIQDFKRGYEMGRSDAEQRLLGPDSARVYFFYVKIAPLDPDAHSRTPADGIEFTELSSSGELTVSGNLPKRSAGHTVLTVVLSLALLAATIAFIVNLVVFACKFPRRRILTHGNVVSMRRIAASLGALGLVSYGLTLDEYLWLQGNVVLEGYRALFPTPPSALIIALILWAMAEIMNLAGRLQTEQDLTI